MDSRKYLLAVNPEPNQPDLRLICLQERITFAKQLGYFGAIMEAVKLVPFTLKNPIAIFEGLRPPDDKYSGESPGWLCYCSRPICDFTRSGQECNPKPRKVFLVFVNDDRIIFDWGWEDADGEALDDKRYMPRDYKTRFRKQVR